MSMPDRNPAGTRQMAPLVHSLRLILARASKKGPGGRKKKLAPNLKKVEAHANIARIEGSTNAALINAGPGPFAANVQGGQPFENFIRQLNIILDLFLSALVTSALEPGSQSS